MNKIWATVVKEWKLFKRDVIGMCFLILLPILLMIVMSIVQDVPFREMSGVKIKMLIVNEDEGKFSYDVVKALKTSPHFTIKDSVSLDEAKGSYNVAVILTKGITGSIVNSANVLSNHISQLMGLPNVYNNANPDKPGVNIELLYDPATKPNYKASVAFAVDKFVTASSTKTLFERIQNMAKSQMPTNNIVESDQQDIESLFKSVQVVESTSSTNESSVNLNMSSVQHNVPAWAIFGIFFIVLPIAGNMIKEREDGSYTRLKLIPKSIYTISIGKIVFYITVCVIQFYIMMGIGIWIMPYLGLPAFIIGDAYLATFLAILCIAFTATAYGYLIGTLFKTANQAMALSAVSIVILSALGGIWMPVDLMPKTMQKIAMLSPLQWSYQAINDIFLRGSDWQAILLPCSLLVVFGMVFWSIGYIKQRKIGL
jgi:ABC-2 type transport system permease protein